MSRKFPYLDIAVSVTEDGVPATFNLTEGAPTVDLPSLGHIVRHFVGLSEGYMMWNVDDRRAYSLFAIDSEVPSAMLTVTLLCQRSVLVSGRYVVNLLSALKNAIMGGEDLDTKKVERLIESAGFSENPLRSDYDPWGAPADGGLCCRTFASPGELGNILGFPRQKDYADFRCVVIVPSSVMMAPESELTQITTPVDKALMVVCPDDAVASAPCVNFSDHLTVTYSCPGFESVAVMFEVGTTNRYVRISGPALVVNDAYHAGIIFRRRVPYTVSNPAGQPIDTYTILVNSRTANRTSEGFEVSNTDFEEGMVKVTVSSTNFGTYIEYFTAETLPSGEPLEIVLEPESKDILLRIDFGDGRIIEEPLYLEKNTPEYQQLRAGRFHGFRAHRLMGSKPETYNIDLKHVVAAATPAPTLPFETVVTAPAPDATPAVAPPVEQPAAADLRPADKMPADIWEKRGTRKAPVFDKVTGDEAGDSEADTASKKRTIVLAVIAVVAVGLLVWGCSKLLSSCGAAEQTVTDSEVVNDSTEVAAELPAIGIVTATTGVSTPDNEIEGADVSYLNDNNTWRKGSLRSEKYKALFTALEAGDVDAFVANEYFAVADRSTNKMAQQCADLLWKAKGTVQGKRHIKLMKEKSEGGSVNLRELFDALARVMPPKADYNTAPRPSKK